jgi:hypothetical protein
MKMLLQQKNSRINLKNPIHLSSLMSLKISWSSWCHWCLVFGYSMVSTCEERKHNLIKNGQVPNFFSGSLGTLFSCGSGCTLQSSSILNQKSLLNYRNCTFKSVSNYQLRYLIKK